MGWALVTPVTMLFGSRREGPAPGGQPGAALLEDMKVDCIWKDGPESTEWQEKAGLSVKRSSVSKAAGQPKGQEDRCEQGTTWQSGI